MSDTGMIVTVTLYKDENRNGGIVTEQIVRIYDGSHGFEVENLFYKLGELIAPKIDPYHNRE